MKKTILVILSGFYSLCSYGQISAEQTAWQQPVDFSKKTFLLKTNWDQWGEYARFSPDHQVLGCWSTALAQVLYYHQLKPFGSVQYNCTKGYAVRDTLEKHSLNWADFVPEITPGSAPEKKEAVARYIFMTAEAIRKDFGTGRYLEMVNPVPQLEKHFQCKAEFYTCITGDIPFPKPQMDEIVKNEKIRHLIKEDSVRLLIRNEIKAGRPVYFHFGNFSSYGHSTVIDGYHELNNTFFVHINYGSSGFRTGWYNLFEPIDVKDDLRLRAFVTIRPILPAVRN